MVEMMLRFVMAALMLTGSLQDPTKTLPDSYKVEFENNYVRVVRVHYDAGAKLPEHTHAGGTTVYVYLNDSEGVVFAHSGNNNREVTRPAVKAGAIRIASGPEEHHTVANTSSTASDFLRVYFKTDDGGVRNLRQRLSPTEEFTNKQMRITRLTVQPGDKTLIEAKDHPVLRITASRGLKQWKTLPENFVRWLDKGTTEEFSATGEFPADIIRIDLLTKP